MTSGTNTALQNFHLYVMSTYDLNLNIGKPDFKVAHVDT